MLATVTVGPGQRHEKARASVLGFAQSAERASHRSGVSFGACGTGVYEERVFPDDNLYDLAPNWFFGEVRGGTFPSDAESFVKTESRSQTDPALYSTAAAKK